MNSNQEALKFCFKHWELMCNWWNNEHYENIEILKHLQDPIIREERNSQIEQVTEEAESQIKECFNKFYEEIKLNTANGFSLARRNKRNGWDFELMILQPNKSSLKDYNSTIGVNFDEDRNLTLWCWKKGGNAAGKHLLDVFKGINPTPSLTEKETVYLLRHQISSNMPLEDIQIGLKKCIELISKISIQQLNQIVAEL